MHAISGKSSVGFSSADQPGRDINEDRPLKEGRNGLLRGFQQLRSYRDEIERRNREEIPFSSRRVPRGLSVAEEP